MIKIEKVEVFGWEAAIRGMRNPMNSWEKSDTNWLKYYSGNDINRCLGANDLALMKNLAKAGVDHGKFLRMINVTVDITAPLYWWKEMSTYSVGVVTNSCSTMHTIHSKEFEIEDFSHEHLNDGSRRMLGVLVEYLNAAREAFNLTKNKDFWWQIIQLLPASYNQKRTVQLNYQVLKNMYYARKNHKLDEWREFCKRAEMLPYFKEICIND